jgi:hypothetical protein
MGLDAHVYKQAHFFISKDEKTSANDRRGHCTAAATYASAIGELLLADLSRR